MKTDLQGFKHFKSYEELDNFLDEDKVNEMELEDIWYVSCDAYGEIRRGRRLFKWESPPKENLYVVRSEIEDTITLTNHRGNKYTIDVKNIPIRNDHSIWLTNKEIINVLDEMNQKQPINTLGIIKRVSVENADSRGVKK